jgi:hypothetical protein
MDIPIRPEDVTADWLTDAFRESGHLGLGRVSSVRVQPLETEKGMTGQLARVTIEYDAAETEAPSSLVVKCSSPDPAGRAVVHSMGFYEREVSFYQQLAEKTPVRTPQCYYGDIDLEEGLSVLLLEDLTAARNGSQTAGCTVEEARVAVLELAALHAAWWQQPALEDKGWLELAGLVSVPQMTPVFEQSWSSFLSKLTVPVTDEILQMGDWVRSHLEWASAQLYLETPYTLVHNDFQADNLIFSDDADAPSLTVIDWQLATHGRPAMDVGWFLGGNIATDLRRTHENDLLLAYHACLLDNGVRGYTFADCLRDYRLSMIVAASRLSAAVGFSPEVAEQQGGFWDAVFPRYCLAASDLRVGELLSSS